jgi:hypothetical protein
MAEVLLGVGASRHGWGWWWQPPTLPAPTIPATVRDPPRAGWLLLLTVPDEEAGDG